MGEFGSYQHLGASPGFLINQTNTRQKASRIFVHISELFNDVCADLLKIQRSGRILIKNLYLSLKVNDTSALKIHNFYFKIITARECI
jgi:hypothetical protein